MEKYYNGLGVPRINYCFSRAVYFSAIDYDAHLSASVLVNTQYDIDLNNSFDIFPCLTQRKRPCIPTMLQRLTIEAYRVIAQIY
jgi:hypothetical protein